MKKKLLIALIAIIAALCCAIGFTACDGDDSVEGGIDSVVICEHNYVSKTVAPTCGESGYTLYTCNKCGDYYKDNYIDPTGNHNFGTYTYNNDATCGAAGTETAKCKNCNREDVRTSTSHPATGAHDYGTYTYNNDATCGEDGTETAKCKNCNAKDTRIKTGTATGDHTPDNKFYSTNTAHWRSCKTCSKHVSETAHIYNNKNKCIECGYTLEIDEGLNFKLSDDRYYYTVTGWNLDITNFIVPSFYNDKPVKLGSSTPFYNCNFRRIVFTSGIMEIPQQSFSLLSQLREVVIPESVTSIGMQAFMGCSKLTDIWCEAQSKPSGWNSGWASYIGSDVKIHWGGEWRYVHGVPVLNSETVEDEDAHVYSKVWSTDYDYHWYEPICGHEAAVEKYEHEFDRDDLCPECGYILEHTKELTYSGNKEYTVTGLTSSADGVKLIYIPTTYLGSPVTAIKENAFKGQTSIEKVIIPNSVKTIGANAFDGCTGLRSIVIPNSVKSIGDNAFNGCNFETVKISGSFLKYITKSNLKNVTISDGAIPQNAFENCKKIDNVIIGDGVTGIGSYAFSGCTALKSITIPDSVTSIGADAFKNCPIETATIPAIACNFVKNSKLKTVIITSGKSIGKEAFRDCSSLTNITIPDSVTSIGEQAFYSCSSLTSIIISDSVTSIGYGAFVGCISLKNVTVGREVTIIGDYAFIGCFSLVSIMVDERNKNYKSINGNLYSKDGKIFIQYAVGKKASSFDVPDGVISIGAGAFASSKCSITIPDSVTNIGDGAFSSCIYLRSIAIPDSVISIGSHVFDSCSSLTDIDFNGTKEQWNVIEKGSDWNYNTGKYTIHCTDGDLEK